MLSAAAILFGVEFVCGAVGGIAAGRWARGHGFRPTLNGMIGGVGGLVMVLLAGRIPGVARFVGYAETAADATMQAVGGVTPAILLGVGIAGLIGGTVLVFLASTVGALARG